MSEQAFRKTECTCYGCAAESRLREIIKEQAEEIRRLTETVTALLVQGKPPCKHGKEKAS